MKTWMWVFVVLVVVGGGWYFLGGSSASLPGGSSTAMQEPGADGYEDPVIGDNLALGIDGTHLIGYNGMTVYTKTGDSATASTCYDQCAINWPPYVVAPSDVIKNVKVGVNGSVGTLVRTDGNLQLTYNGKPLYFYIGDKAGSDTTGEGLNGVWYIVKP
ncbi:MAG: hypothetical protein Q8R25_04010 [bacterium]|nr:hypothetical protein [bacterium]